MNILNKISLLKGLWDHISEVTDSVHDLERRIQKAKDNTEEIQNIMRSWVSPIFERKDGKRESLFSLDDRHESLEKRYKLIKESGFKIHSLVKVSSPTELFENTIMECFLSKGSVSLPILIKVSRIA